MFSPFRPSPGLLFHRAILMSGSGLAPWSLVSDPAYYAAIVSNHVGCSPDLPYVHLMKCLRERPLEALLSTPIRPPDFGNAFGPSVDGVVIGKNTFSICKLFIISHYKSIFFYFTQTRMKWRNPILAITITGFPHRKYQIIIR